MTIQLNGLSWNTETQEELKYKGHNSIVLFDDLTYTQKQNLASRFLDLHPLRLQNSLVEYVLRQSNEDHETPFSYDDITNNSPTANIELSDQWVDLTESDRDEMLEELQEKFDELYGDIEDTEGHPEQENIETLSSDIEALESVDFDNYPEIYQWFSCSVWLIRELESRGECTLDDEFWGRQCFGQSVTLDHVMQEIAYHWFLPYKEKGLTQEKVKELR